MTGVSRATATNRKRRRVFFRIRPTRESFTAQDRRDQDVADRPFNDYLVDHAGWLYDALIARGLRRDQATRLAYRAGGEGASGVYTARDRHSRASHHLGSCSAACRAGLTYHFHRRRA